MRRSISLTPILGQWSGDISNHRAFEARRVLFDTIAHDQPIHSLTASAYHSELIDTREYTYGRPWVLHRRFRRLVTSLQGKRPVRAFGSPPDVLREERERILCLTFRGLFYH